jgi:hypothetical protein
MEAVSRIGATTNSALERASACGVTPLAAAEEQVAERLGGPRRTFEGPHLRA